MVCSPWIRNLRSTRIHQKDTYCCLSLIIMDNYHGPYIRSLNRIVSIKLTTLCVNIKIDKHILHAHFLKYIYIVHVRNEAMEVGPPWAHNLFVRWAKDFLLWVVLGTKTQQTCFSLSPSLSLLLFLVFSSSPSS